MLHYNDDVSRALSGLNSGEELLEILAVAVRYEDRVLITRCFATW